MNSISESQSKPQARKDGWAIRAGLYFLLLPFALLLTVSGLATWNAYSTGHKYNTPLDAFFGAFGLLGLAVLVFMVPAFSMSLVGLYLTVLKWRSLHDWFAAGLCIFPVIGLIACAGYAIELLLIVF